MFTNEKLKIVFFIPSLSMGGAEKVFVTLANRFCNLGHKVTIVTLGLGGQLSGELDKRVCQHSLNASRLALCLPGLLWFLVRNKIDVFVSGLQYPNIISSFAHLLSLSKAKLIVTEHSNSTELLKKLTPWRRSILKLGVNLAYSRASTIVAVSEGVKECLNNTYKMPAWNVVVIHNPVDLQRIHLLSQEDLNHPWFDEKSLPVVVAVGRLSVEKNFSLLIRAFLAVTERIEARLAIIGDGPLRIRLESEAASLGLARRIMFVGFSTNPYYYILRSNVLVVSSTREGFSNVIVEGLALGKPIVSTDCKSGPSEILLDGVYGRLVPVNDEVSLAAAIVQAIKESNFEGLHRARDFDADKIAAKYLEVFVK